MLVVKFYDSIEDDLLSIMNAMAIGTNLIFGKMADISIKYSMASGALFCFIGLIVYSIWNQKLNSGK